MELLKKSIPLLLFIAPITIHQLVINIDHPYIEEKKINQMNKQDYIFNQIYENRKDDKNNSSSNYKYYNKYGIGIDSDGGHYIK